MPSIHVYSSVQITLIFHRVYGLNVVSLMRVTISDFVMAKLHKKTSLNQAPFKKITLKTPPQLKNSFFIELQYALSLHCDIIKWMLRFIRFFWLKHKAFYWLT